MGINRIFILSPGWLSLGNLGLKLCDTLGVGEKKRDFVENAMAPHN